MNVGTALTLTETHYGCAINARRGGRWRHPWTITPAWLARTGPRGERLGRWVATVWPGFVNGLAPIVRKRVTEQRVTGRDFGVNPLTGKRFFSDPIFSQDNVRPVTEVIDIPLYLDPAIALTWRRVGWDGEGAVPQFFKNRGAADAPAAPGLDDAASGAIDTPTRPRNLRLLRACDIILHQPRLALTSQITLQPGPATGISNVTQTLGVRSPVAGDTLRVFAGDSAPAVSVDPLSGDYEEATWDERLIGTVFLLSVPGLPDGSEPDGTWTPHVRHELFWNLDYAPARFRPVTTDAGTPFIPPLAAGAAQLVINFLTASLNDMTQQSLNILQAHSMAGTFYTPTGRDATFPPAEELAVPAGVTGGDKAGRLAAREAARAAARRAERLDPAFPYRDVPFDPALLPAA